MLLDLFSVEYAQRDTHDYAAYDAYRKRHKKQQEVLEARESEKLAYVEHLRKQIRDIISPTTVIAPTKLQNHHKLGNLQFNIDKAEQDLSLLEKQIAAQIRFIREEDDILTLMLALH